MSTNSEAARLDWGAGKVVNVVDNRNGRFEMTFEGEVPSTKKIKVDAIDILGKCRPLMVSPAVSGKTVVASGQTQDAYRARIYLMEDDGAKIREASLPGSKQMPFVKGPEGGSLIFIGHDGETATAEAVPASGGWKLVFADDGRKIRAPAVIDVEVEAIGPGNADDQVRRLSVSAGPDSSSLQITGNVAGASHIRLAIKDGNHWHTRCVPLG